MRGLDRLAHHADQLALERVEVELVAQAAAERLQRARRVVAAAVEAPVDDGLDACERGAEQARDRQGRDRDGQSDRPTASPMSSTLPRYALASVAVSTP